MIGTGKKAVITSGVAFGQRTAQTRSCGRMIA
jgi:hypothetical protein